MRRATLSIFFLAFPFLTILKGQTSENKLDSSQVQKGLILIDPETGPTYLGGLQAWKKHVEKIIKPLEQPCKEGKVYVQFKVLVSGKVDSVKIARGLCDLANKNALEIIKTSGRWQPGQVNGKSIDSWINVQFRYHY